MKNDQLHINEFNEMSMSYWAQYTWGHGQQIAKALEEDYSYLLYRVEDYFVEVCYDFDDNKIVDVYSLVELGLQKYLDDIFVTDSM